MTKADEIIRSIGDELENANYHDLACIPEDLWGKIKKYISEEDQEEVANIFYEVFRI